MDTHLNRSFVRHLEHEALKNLILQELKAFEGVTRSMIQARINQSIVVALDELIEDGLVVHGTKNVEGREAPVRVLYSRNRRFDALDEDNDY